MRNMLIFFLAATRKREFEVRKSKSLRYVNGSRRISSFSNIRHIFKIRKNFIFIHCISFSANSACVLSGETLLTIYILYVNDVLCANS